MKTALTYSKAFAALEKLVDQLEEGGVELEHLPEKIKEANELIEVCEMKLRKASTDTESATRDLPLKG